MLILLGVLNLIYGIAALDNANILVNDTRLVLTNLSTMGWVLIVLGAIQLIGGVSLLGGNVFGRTIGVIGGILGALGALLSIGGAFPWWSLAIFFLCVWVTWGILVFGEDEEVAR
ncbi:MAG: hypothetical protein KDB66_03530 [Solirubrobacterales bacterium]|nr:hypothetical protein [Solirubrobacterales bacterium]MCB8915436.1 hypothetical protein [Thermoleophilales bacterium]